MPENIGEVVYICRGEVNMRSDLGVLGEVGMGEVEELLEFGS